MTDMRADWVRTKVGQNRTTLPRTAQRDLGRARGIGVRSTSRPDDDTAGLVLVRAADMRYKGQEHTVKVPMTAARIGPDELAEVERRFADLHEKHYTFRLDAPVEFVNFHLTALRPQADARVLAPRTQDGDVAEAGRGTRMVHFDDHGRHEASIYERERLPTATLVDGPAVIEEPAASTLVFPGQRFWIDELSNLVIEV